MAKQEKNITDFGLELMGGINSALKNSSVEQTPPTPVVDNNTKEKTTDGIKRVSLHIKMELYKELEAVKKPYESITMLINKAIADYVNSCKK